ncbi:conserved Plasmodium protein, unknown function [Plasmodium gallinaceum]|uniref:PH domain-containing protein n=1 Tax=Plasmodium gallinaceum TaxID=5849 RepID=A0A1J1GRC6_PLAGA|nr:conserved Plasmodium protein, unknown function [Plasmodium gallinaceum]CRG95087.1 conserved Plasmodium protein, unknown function [Plasmodium gallinaceum]
MFDVSSLIFFGNCNSAKKSISGNLYMYRLKKKKNFKEYPYSCFENNRINDIHNDSTISKEGYNINNKWVKYFCFIKANFFYVYKLKGDYRPDTIFLLEGCQIKIINYYVALKNKIIEENDEFNLKNNEDIIQIKTLDHTDGQTYLFYVNDKGVLKKWFNTLNNSNFSSINNNIKIIKEENEEVKNNIDNIKKLNDIEIKNKEIEISNLKERINSLKATIENIRTKNKRLQIASEVNIKSADEFLQKKITEMEFIHNELGLKMEENNKLKETIIMITDESEKKLKLINDLKNEKKTLEKKLNEIMATYEEACNNPEKLTLINYNTNERYQKIVLNNKNLKQEIIKLNERFYNLEDRYREKIKTIKEIVEIGDIFDYLHKLIVLCQTKIKFYEQSYKYNEEQQKEIMNSIEYLIKETKLSEANARVCYITHRSKILEERLSYYINHTWPSDYFYFACTTLRRLGWVFGEIEVLNPVIGDNKEVYPLYSYIDDMNVIPMREQIYFNEGMEGRGNFNIVNDVDIYSMPVKMCPYEEKILSDNKYNYIKIKLTDLKNDFNILKKKTKPQNRSMISNLQWDEIKKNAYDRLEKNMIILDKQISTEKKKI